MKKNAFILPLLFMSTFSYAQQWSAWLDRDLPGGAGDYETLGDFPPTSVCGGKTPLAIEARYQNGSNWTVIKPGDNAPNYLRGFAPHIGLVCINTDQPTRNLADCTNYQVRFACTLPEDPAAREDLSVKYPGLKEIDKQNAEYSKTAPYFIGRFPVNAPRAVQPVIGTPPGAGSNAKTTGEDEGEEIVEGVFNLGHGFDTINSTYRNQCLDQTHPDFKIKSNPSTVGSHLEILHISSRSDFYDAMDVNLTLGASGTFKVEDIDIKAGIDLTTSSVKIEHLMESHEVFVAKYAHHMKRYTLTTQARPIKDSVVNLLLRKNEETYKRDFFSECGDRFVDGAELGAKLYVVFTYDKKSIKDSSKNEVSGKMNLAIEDIFKMNLTASRKKEITSFMETYKVKIFAVTLGGPNMVHMFNVTEATNFKTHLDNFATGINDDNMRAIDTFYREYTLPAIYASDDYYSVFANTTTYINYAQKYAAIANEYDARCAQLREYNMILGSNFDTKFCSNGTLKSDIGAGRRNCGISNLWSNCIHPRDHVLQSGALLLDELSKNIPTFSQHSWTSGIADNYVKTKAAPKLSIKKCISDSRTACMSAGCFENKYETANGKGFNYVEMSYYSPATSGEQGTRDIGNVYTDGANRRCVDAYVKACTRDALGSSAFYKFRIEILGVCPTITNFPSD